MERPIYLDYNATTPVDPAAVEAMVLYLFERFGNPSSGHAYGQEAHAAMDQAREQVAKLIGCEADEVIFTGGGSEADNLAITGAVFGNLDRRPHVVSSVIEHPAVLATLDYLERRFGVAHTLVPADQDGMVSPESVRDAIRPETVLVSVMHANNEVGTIQPIREMARYTRQAEILLHVDAAQSVGKIEVDVEELGVDLLTVASHKLYGPKGSGALYVGRGTLIDPLIHGGGQERGLRAGTENVASMVGLGKACEIAREKLPEEQPRLTRLRDSLHGLLAARVPGMMLNGHPVRRLPNTLNVSFPDVIGQTVLDCAPAVAASTGSACHAGQTEPSGVLMAMGLSRERALGAVRLSLGRWTAREDVERAAEALAAGYAAAVGVSVTR